MEEEKRGQRKEKEGMDEVRVSEKWRDRAGQTEHELEK